MASLIRNVDPVDRENLNESQPENQPQAQAEFLSCESVVTHAAAATTPTHDLTIDTTLVGDSPTLPSPPSETSAEPQPRADVIARVKILIAGGYYDKAGFIDLLAEHITTGLSKKRRR